MKKLESNFKRKTKIHLKKIGVLLFGLFFIITNCNDDTDTVLENDNLNSSQKSKNTVEQVFLEDITNITNSIYILSDIAKKSYTQKRNPNFVIDTERIIKATDSIGNTTYAFEILTINEPNNVLYNLIVTQRVDDKKIPAFIIKYEFENTTKYDYATPTDELKFEAKTSIYSYENFLLTGTFKNKGTRNKGTSNGANPCIEIDNTNSSNGSGGSAADNHLNQGNFSTQTNTIGGSMGGFGLYITGGSGGGGGGGSRGKVICGELIMRNYIYSLNKNQNTKTQAKETTNDAPCPEGEILLPVNKRLYKIDDSELKGKAKCIDLLLKANGVDYVINLLKNFEGDSEFDIIIKSANELTHPIKGNKSAGQTHSPNSNNEILIEISTSSIGSKSALETAKTILHEYIHADIHRKLNTENTTNKEILDFQDTYKKYKEQFSSELQHQTMGYLYVNSMRDALKDFHKNVLKSDYDKYTNYNGQEPTDLFYEALAWRGLKEHNVEAYKDIDPEKIKQLEAVDLDIDILTKDCKDAQ